MPTKLLLVCGTGKPWPCASGGRALPSGNSRLRQDGRSRVTELTQPLAAQTKEKTRVPPHPAGHNVTFAELVYAHFDWWRAMRDGTLDEESAAVYHRTRADF